MLVVGAVHSHVAWEDDGLHALAIRRNGSKDHHLSRVFSFAHDPEGVVRSNQGEENAVVPLVQVLLDQEEFFVSPDDDLGGVLGAPLKQLDGPLQPPLLLPGHDVMHDKP